MLNNIINRFKEMTIGGIVTFALLAAAVGVFAFIMVARAVNTSPAQCATCHPVVTAMWEASQSHPSDQVTCSQCHDQDVEPSVNLLGYLRDLAIPEKFSAEPARIEPRCAGCHEGIANASEEKKKLIRINHKAHLEKPLAIDGEAFTLTCLDCHLTVAHDHSQDPTYRPTMAGCFTGSCHIEDRNDDNCRRCHYQNMTELISEK